MKNLTLQSFNDMELLRRFQDVADHDGGATVEDVAKALNLDHPHPTQCISSRFSWLRRYGIMQREGDHWSLTPAGELAIKAKLNRSTENALGKMSESQMVMLTNRLSGGYRKLSAPNANLMRREWQHSLSKRNGRLYK